VLDEAVANGNSDQAQLLAVKQLAGSEHKHAYAACLEIVANDVGYARFLDGIRTAAEQHTGSHAGKRTCRQQTGDLCALYAQAREVLPAFKEQMTTFVAQFNRSQAAASPPGLPAVLHTSTLKHLYRCMEKMCLKGGADRYTSVNICDIDRCIIECDDCGGLSALLQALLTCPAVRVIRVKDRANHITSMNWMDVMDNLVLNADEYEHVCEIQVVHSKMYLARKGLGGHGPYGQVRAASEILEVRKKQAGHSSRRHHSARDTKAKAGAPGEERAHNPTVHAQAGTAGAATSTFSVANPMAARAGAVNVAGLSSEAHTHIQQIYDAAMPALSVSHKGSAAIEQSEQL
jgi:hypothetical protein